jgi:type III secretory pathway component EscU
MYAQRTILNKSQQALKEAHQIQDIIDKIRNSWLFKMMNSPWGIAFMALFAVLLAVLIAVIMVVSGGAAALIVAVIVIAVVTLAVGIAVGVNTEKTRGEIDDIGGGDASPRVKSAIEKAKKLLREGTLMLVGAVLLTGIMAAGAGALFNPATSAAAVMGMITLIVGMVTAAFQVLQGLMKIITARFDLFIAEVVRDINVEKAKLEKWQARSKFIGDILSHFQEGLKGFWEFIQAIIDAQSSLIKTLGDGSTAITRNIKI